MAFLSNIVKKTQNPSSSKITEQLVYSNLEKKLNKWNIPKMNPNKIYHKGLLDFKQSYVIKRYEESVSIGNVTESLSLLSNKILED